MDLTTIAKIVAGSTDKLRLRQAEVTAVAGDGTLSVKIGGSDVVVSGVKAFDSVSVAPAESVWLVTDGADLIAIGRIGSAAGGGAAHPGPGIVEMWGGSIASIPSGSLLCDGASYLRTAYPELFAAIGTTWGAVDGSHFNVPPADRFLVGAGSAYAAGGMGGNPTHTHAAHPAHQHTDPTTGAADRALSTDAQGYHSHGGATGYGDQPVHRDTAGSGNNAQANLHVHGIGADGSHAHTAANHLHYGGNATTGGPGAQGHDSPSHVPPYAALPWIIWT